MKADRRLATVEVVILYDNINAGKHATELCHRVAGTLGTQYELQLHCWRLSTLATPPVAAVVARQTASAPCLVVAIDGRDLLPAALKDFLNAYIRAMPNRPTLVAQLHGVRKMNHKLSPAYCGLIQIAQDLEIPFFSELVLEGDSVREQQYEEEVNWTSTANRSTAAINAAPSHSFCSVSSCIAGGR